MTDGILRIYWRGRDVIEDEWRGGRWVMVYGPGVQYPSRAQPWWEQKRKPLVSRVEDHD